VPLAVSRPASRSAHRGPVPLAVSRPASRGAHCGPVPLHRILCCCALSMTPAPCAAALYFTLAISGPSLSAAYNALLCCCALSMTPAPCAAALYFTLATPAPSLSAATLHTLLLRPLHYSFASATSRCAFSLSAEQHPVPVHRTLSCCVDHAPKR
jgi:hypothetical protein